MNKPKPTLVLAILSFLCWSSVSAQGYVQMPGAKVGEASGLSSDLYRMKPRYYNAELKRFLSSDPIGLSGELNLYVYGSDNPLAFLDPLGLKVVFGYDDSVGRGGRAEIMRVFEVEKNRRHPDGALTAGAQRLRWIEADSSHTIAIQASTARNVFMPDDEINASIPSQGSGGAALVNPRPIGTLSDGTPQHAGASLVHEVGGHGYDSYVGNRPAGLQLGNAGWFESERRATYVENEQRSAIGIQQRQRYAPGTPLEFNAPQYTRPSK